MHIPVLIKEVIGQLNPQENENFIDCTFGWGGYSEEILKHNGPNGKVLGIEWDAELYRRAQEKNTNDRLLLVNDSYANLDSIIKKNNFGSVNGIVFDLGFSSWHLEESGRGFSFQKDEPLVMRYHCQVQSSKLKVQSEENDSEIRNYEEDNAELTAEKIVNEYSENEIEEILKNYGEEGFAKKIAERIVVERKVKPIKTTFQLVEVIGRAVPSWYKHRKIHFATKTFQALRIAVNSEIDNLKNGLEKGLEALAIGGRMVVVSFHSLEDRIVKNFFKERAVSISDGQASENGKSQFKILTKKPIMAVWEEVKNNPRGRSAKLRSIIKTQ